HEFQTCSTEDTLATIETTGLADPAPILHTLMTDPIVAAGYVLDGVVTTVDAVNGAGSLDRQPVAVKQAAVGFVTVTGCGPERRRDRTEFQATATAACHRAAASALKMRRVDRETRCRGWLKVVCTADWELR